MVDGIQEGELFIHDAFACQGGALPAKVIATSHKVDVVLLELLEAVGESLVIPLSMQQVAIKDKIVESAGYASENGAWDSFEVKVGHYDGTHNLYAVSVLSGKGMSGAPVLYRGLLVGIFRLQDNIHDKDAKTTKTYLTPLNAFCELLNEHVVSDGKKIDAVSEPDIDLDGTRIPSTEFDETIRERINELFKADDFQTVQKKISELAGQKVSGTIGEMLCSPNIEIESAVGWLNQAAAEVVQAIPRDVEGEQRRKAFKDTAEKILGWLVLRTVDPVWVEQHGSELLKNRGARLTVRLDYTSCVEVIVARTFQRESRFQGKYRTVQGRGAVSCLTTESGIEPAPNTDALFKAIYKQVLRAEITGVVTDKDERELLRMMKSHLRSGLRYYLTVPVDELGAGLTEGDLKEFHDQYPYLKMIFLRMDSGESALLIDDGELYSLINTFFLRIMEEQA
ncbi:MAG: hypothetical protein D3922_11095 [Candidatus Electrothrix sp. AR1]|nr:hypothetical protein [Candidatus Electrothrix sp. AR1]